MKKIPVIIDCDPGVDDALALMMAFAKKELDIKAITSVSGNVGIEYTTHNARLVAGILGMDVPVAMGAAKPIIAPKRFADKTHGSDGFGGASSLFDENHLAPLSDKNAVELMADVLRNSEEKVTIIAIGPLTNIAVFLMAHPELKDKIEMLSIMGGSTTVGNTAPKVEFNFMVDPHAAHVVLNSSLKIVLAGLNVTLQAYVTDEDIERLDGRGTEVAKVAAKILAAYKANDPALHDPVSVLALTNPEIMKFEDMYMNVETSGIYSSGMSFTDEREERKPPDNITVITEIDRERFVDEMIKCF